VIQINFDVMGCDDPLEALRIRRLFMGKASDVVAASYLASTGRFDPAEGACEILEGLDLLGGRVGSRLLQLHEEQVCIAEREITVPRFFSRIGEGNLAA
jgi:hypothetical protein